MSKLDRFMTVIKNYMEIKEDEEPDKNAERKLVLQNGLFKFVLKGALQGLLFGIVSPTLYVLLTRLFDDTWCGWSKFIKNTLAITAFMVVLFILLNLWTFGYYSLKEKKLKDNSL